ncbi:hypothetical protein XocBAI20_03155 [Xanthomonas oryzae pv. oryzicola]|nr:hypothetical protein XocBAI20_03155 [Xanthomonas oryzae pv. oryzicola]
MTTVHATALGAVMGEVLATPRQATPAWSHSVVIPLRAIRRWRPPNAARAVPAGAQHSARIYRCLRRSATVWHRNPGA